MPAVTLSTRTAKGRGRRSRTFIERTLASLADGLGHALAAENLAQRTGLLQSLDPRVKVAGMAALIVATAMSRNLWVILELFIAALILAVSSHVAFSALGKRVWVPVLIFTGGISLPALFLTPGRIIDRVPVLGWPVTLPGMTAAAYLVSRAETASTLAVLLALCTPWNHVLKSLRVFRLPAVVVVILGMTYRYILVLLQTAHDMFESRQSRVVGRLDGRERRRLMAATAGVLLAKSLQASEDIYMAMQSRGFHGEVRTLDDFHARWYDWAALAILAALAGSAFWLGR